MDINEPLLPERLVRALMRSRLARAVLITSVAGVLATPAFAQLPQTVTWDSDPLTPGIQTGDGDWDGGAFWLNAANQNVLWQIGWRAVFTGQSTVDAGGITADDIAFNGSGSLATLQSGASGLSLRLGGGNHVHSLTVTAADGKAQITANTVDNDFDVRKEGAGTLTLSGANYFGGGLAVNAGTLEAGGGTSQALGNTTVAIASGATLRLLTSQETGKVDGAGTVELTGASVLKMTNTPVNDSSGATFTGTGGLTVHSGYLILTGANSFTGGLIVDNGGSVSTSLFGGTGVDNPLGRGSITLNSGELEYAASAAAFTDQPVILNGTSTFRVFNPAAVVTLSGLVTGSSSNLWKTGNGTLILSNSANSFNSYVAIFQGTLSVADVADIGSNSALGSGSSIHFGYSNGISPPARLQFTGGGSDSTNREVTIDSTGGIIEVVSNAELALTGLLDGAGSLQKAGAGRLEIAGDKTFTGPIMVAAGSLRLAGSIPGSDTIVSGGVLEISGTRTIGDLTLDGGALSLAIGGVVSYDSLNVTGAVTLDGPTPLSINLGYDPEDFVSEFRIITNDDTDSTVFNGPDARFVYAGNVLEDGEGFVVQSGTFSQYFVFRAGTDGDNDVRLVAAPEPSSMLLLLVGGAVLQGRRRRRQRD